MNFHGLWLLCLLIATLSMQAVRSGEYTKIGKNVTIALNAVIGDYVIINSHTVIKENSSIGQYSEISEHCTIRHYVVIGKYVQVASQTIIDDFSLVNDHASIGEKCSISYIVRVGQHSKIGNNNKIGMGSLIGQYSKTANDVEIDKRAVIDQYAKFDGKYLGQRGYVGQYCVIESNVKVGDWAVVHQYARISFHAFPEIKPTEIAIRTPTSLLLYEQCTRNVSSAEINIAKPTGQTISPEFNKLLRELIENSMKILRKNCLQSNGNKSPPPNLSKIVSLYLIQYHGYDRFKEYTQEVSLISLRNMLAKEYHFNDGSAKNVLEPDVREKLIQLLTIDLDARRPLRVLGDKFCKMFNEIENKQRNILLVGSSSSHRNFIHAMVLLISVLINLKIMF